MEKCYKLILSHSRDLRDGANLIFISFATSALHKLLVQDRYNNCFFCHYVNCSAKWKHYTCTNNGQFATTRKKAFIQFKVWLFVNKNVYSISSEIEIRETA